MFVAQARSSATAFGSHVKIARRLGVSFGGIADWLTLPIWTEWMFA
jgi:hypothetical protein